MKKMIGTLEDKFRLPSIRVIEVPEREMRIKQKEGIIE